MGNTNSKGTGECPMDILASLSPKSRKKIRQIAHLNTKLTTPDLNILKKKNKKNTSDQSLYSQNKDGLLKSSSSTSTLSLFVDDSMLISPPLTPLIESDTVVIVPFCNSKINFEIVNGRRYQSSPGTHFYLPCDDEEADRLVIMHFLIKNAFDGNVAAPVIENLQVKLEKDREYRPKVLDVGCGPGTWVLEMATEFPNSEFYGIDLRTMFPSMIKPKNTHFLQHDFFQGLPFPDNSFEFVRMRSMLAFITQDQLLLLLSEIQRVLKPLGYIELLDVEYQIHRPGPICDSILNQQLQTTMHNKGIDFLASHHLSTLLMTQPADGGFIDVHQHRVTIPIGWGGQLGQVHAQNLCSFLQSIHPNVKNDIILPDQTLDTDTLIESAVKECTTMQSHMNWFVCYGQKPATTPFHHVSATTPTPLLAQASVKNNTHNTSMITPSSSPSVSSIDLRHHEQTWDCIHDFADGYTD